MAKKALLVDDSKSARIVLSRLLQKYEFDVDMVESGEAALDYLDDHRPDAIFIDYMMDGMDGLETIERIKKDPAIAKIPIVMCTANESENSTTAALSYGAVGVLSKPPTKEKLSEVAALIEREIDTQQATEELAYVERPQSEEVAPTSVISAEEVRELASKAAVNALSEQIGPLVEQAISDQVEGVVRAHMPDLTELKEVVVDEIMQKLEKVIHEANDQVVAEVIETHFRAQWEEFNSTLNERLAVFHKGLQEELPRSGPVIQQIRDIAESTVEASATEAASRIARDVASNIATESTEELLNEALEDQIESSSKAGRVKRQLMGMAYISMALSIVAVVLVLYLMR